MVGARVGLGNPPLVGGGPPAQNVDPHPEPRLPLPPDPPPPRPDGPPPPPPGRDGVGASSLQLPAGSWPSLLAFLQHRFPGVSAATWRERMERGLVLDAGGGPLGTEAAYVPGTRLYYYRELPAEPQVPFEAELLYRDEHLLVADKPHFLAVVPAGRFLQQSLLVRLRNTLGLDQLAPLHRLDRGTAGVILFSTEPRSRGLYQSLFAQRAVTKTYEALAPSLPDTDFPLVRRSRLVEGEPFFRMREAEGPPNSETRIELLERRGELSLYGLQPVSGRKHQLRVHLAALGAPIVNDPFYPDLQPAGEDDYARPLKLLARAIAFRDPISGAERRFVSRRSL